MGGLSDFSGVIGVFRHISGSAPSPGYEGFRNSPKKKQNTYPSNTVFPNVLRILSAVAHNATPGDIFCNTFFLLNVNRHIRLSFEAIQSSTVQMQAAHLWGFRLMGKVQQGVVWMEQGRIEDIKATWSNVPAGKQSSTTFPSPSFFRFYTLPY